MGYLIPVTPQAFVNRISIFGPYETNIKEISYQLSLHLTIPINIYTTKESRIVQFWPGINFFFDYNFGLGLTSGPHI